MKHILLTNDDGYKSAGYYPLLDELVTSYKVMAIAPNDQRSWVGKAVSAHSPVRLEKITHEGHDIYVTSGTPADCVQIGLFNLLDTRPDFVVSGINVGSNAGHGRILSSGTIGAAMEGAIDGVMSIAVSLCNTSGRGIDYTNPANYHYFETAAKLVSKILRLLETLSLPSMGIDVVTINIPFDAGLDTDIAITKPAIDSYGKVFERTDNEFTHVGAPMRFENLQEGTDVKAIYEGKIAVTPIDLRLATKEALTYLEEQLKPLWGK